MGTDWYLLDRDFPDGTQRDDASISDSFFQVSVGLESQEDLIADLAAALDRV